MPDKCLDCPVPSADMDGFIVSGPGGAPRSDSEGVSGSEGPFAKEAPQTGHVTIMGTLGADGNPGSLPDVPQVGWAYVAKDVGTYGGVQATEGDVVYCVSLNPVRWGVLQADSDDSGQDLVRASLSFSADPLPSLSLETETAAGVSSVQTVDVSALAVDESVLHKTGTETVLGEKVFSGLQTTPSGNASALLVVKDPNLVKGETPSTNHFLSLGFIDSTGNSYAQDVSSRLAVMEYKSPSEADPEGYTQMSDMGFNGGGSAILRVGHDKDNIRFASAPATSDNRINPTDIVTRGYMEASEWNWQKTKKAGAVTFKPVPESDLEPVVDFMFTETSPAEGEKGPENPSTISGVSEVKATRSGKNIIDFPYAETSSFTRAGITYITASDGSITANGTATASSVFYILGQSRKKRYRVGDVITASGTPTNAPDGCRLLFERSRLDGSYIGNHAITSNNLSYTFTAQDDGFFTFTIAINSGVTVSNVVFYPQIEYGSTVTAFEPYEGNDYTIQFGDTYYGGSLDVATGVMTVTWVKVVFGASAINWTRAAVGQNITHFQYTGSLYPGRLSASAAACSHFNRIGSTADAVGFGLYGSSYGGFFHYPGADVSVDAFNGFLADQYTAGTPVTVVYELASPQTVQLTPTQIKSLSALDKYEPRINTVYTNQEAVQVGYQRFYDENRIVAVEARLDAIEAQLP